MITASRSQAAFYREFVMKRGSFDPQEFGIDLPREEFIDRVAGEFSDYVRGQLSFDELLLRPTAALDFCQAIRRKFGWYDVPDDIILRSVMIRRKNPAG